MTKVLRNIFDKLNQHSQALLQIPVQTEDVEYPVTRKYNSKWYFTAPPVLYSAPKPTLGTKYVIKTKMLDYSVQKLSEIARQLKGLSLEAAFDQMQLSSKKPSKAIMETLIQAVKEIKNPPNSERGLRKMRDGVKQARPKLDKDFILQMPLHMMTQLEKKEVQQVIATNNAPSGLFVLKITCGKRHYFKGVRHHARGRAAQFKKPFSQMWITLVEADFMYPNRGNVSHPSKSPRHPQRIRPSRIYVGGLLEPKK